ncbi:MAG: hypothetical protein ACOYKE_04170 [Ferruginibacter sp.]
MHLPGWHSTRKIVVLESDDWGTIRMASNEAYQQLLQRGYPVNQCSYNSNDALECNEDLEQLFEVLNSVRDKNNRPAILTANNIVGNPDFEKIKASDFNEYHFETFDKTLQRYPKHNRVMDLYKEGIEKKLIQPQFHGREHLNVANWMKALQQKDQTALDAFECNMFTTHNGINPSGRSEFLDAFATPDAATIAIEGLEIFKSIWGFQSASFIAPCYIWPSSLEPALAKYGVKFIQSITWQQDPDATGTSYKKRFHFMGQKNHYGQFYLMRNCFYEPAQQPKFNWIDDCLQRMEIAFRWKKPAIIGTHRINYTGLIQPQNRTKGLNGLEQLLKTIVKKWPDVEFMSSDELGALL